MAMTPNHSVSPNDLINQKIKLFEQSHISHKHHEQAYEELVSLAMCPASTHIAMLFGPSGAGKSNLLNRFQLQLIQQAYETMMADPAYLPFIRVDAPPIHRGSFHFREFYMRILGAANDPCIEHKQMPPRQPIDESYRRLLFRKNSSVDALRFAVEQCFKHRKIPILIIDDAMHIAKVLAKRQLINNLDVLKDLAKQTGALIILVGTSEVLPLVDLSAQNIRLSWDIAFPHYEWQVSAEKNEFCKTLLSLLHHMGKVIHVPQEVYDQYYQEFYSGSLGCIGVLKDWLTRALRRALEKGASELAIAHCRASRLSPKQLARMARELRDGADAINERRRTREGDNPVLPTDSDLKLHKYDVQLRELLGMDPVPSGTVSQAAPADSKKTPRRPGKRHPNRDPVGIPQSTPGET